MTKKAIVLIGSLGLAFVGMGAETAPFGSVVGWWRFNDASNRGKDSSEYGNDINALASGVSYKDADTGYTTRGSYDDSGCLYFGTAGNKATATAKTLWDEDKGFTYLMRIRGDLDVSTSLISETTILNLLNMLNDGDKWHLVAMRHDPDKLVGSKTYLYSLFGDNPTLAEASRCEASANSGLYFPLTTDIKIGGTVGAKVSIFTRTASYKGYMDDICVVQRTMTKDEVNYYYQYGDPNPYLTGSSSAAFASSSGWSCNSGETTGYGPTTLPGADFQVDNGLTLTVSSDGTFGGHSLILGRSADLVSVVNSSNKRTKNGHLKAQANLTFGDLRLYNGKLTATGGKTLTAAKLTVSATSASPYLVEVASGTYAIEGAAVGGGWMAKTGAGTLDLSGLTGGAKVRLDAGTLRAAKFDGYTGGTVLVAKGATVAFTGEGALPTAENKLTVRFEGEKPTAKTAVMTVPNGVTEAMIEDSTDYGTGWDQSVVTVESGTVYVTPRKGISSAVTTTEKVSLGYNRLGVNVTLATPGATSVKVILKDEEGATVAAKTAVVADDAASVEFTDLTPGTSYRYDVVLQGEGREVEPTGWETASKDLFKSVDSFAFEDGAFRQATPDANIVISDQMYASKGEALGLVTPTVAPVEGERMVIETRVEVEGAYAWENLPALEGKQLMFGIVLKEGETQDTPANRVWAYKLGAGNWTALTSSTAPVADGTYDLRTVLDYRAGVASCTLTADSADYEIFSGLSLAADKLNRVGVIGGSVAYQNAGYPCVTTPTEVTPTGTTIELDASAKVDLAKLTTGTAYAVTDHGYALTWKDADGCYATKSGNTLTVRAGTPKNGLTSFASHALGLDPEKPLDKPAAIIKPGGLGSSDGVIVYVPNVVKANLPDAGVVVYHQLQRSTDLGQTWADTAVTALPGEELTIPCENGVLYRVNTMLK